VDRHVNLKILLDAVTGFGRAFVGDEGSEGGLGGGDMLLTTSDLHGLVRGWGRELDVHTVLG